MTVRPQEPSGTEVESVAEMQVGTTADMSVAETPSGNTLTMIQVLFDVRELRGDVAAHEAALGTLNAAVAELRAQTGAMSDRSGRLASRGFVLLAALIVAVVAVAAVAYAPQLQELAAPYWPL